MMYLQSTAPWPHPRTAAAAESAGAPLAPASQGCKTHRLDAGCPNAYTTQYKIPVPLGFVVATPEEARDVVSKISKFTSYFRRHFEDN
jgi:hypothetical protein